MRTALFRRLAEAAPDIETILTRSHIESASPARYREADIRREIVNVAMRDGVLLATDLYLPPIGSAPTLVMRTPYGRKTTNGASVQSCLSFARRGYAVVAQDCRGTGESQGDSWNFGLYDTEDGLDVVSWVTTQEWFNGKLFSFGASAVGATQWGMAMHPSMSAIAPEVTGLSISRNSVRRYMFVNVYSKVVGKGSDRLAIPIDEVEAAFHDETMAGGYYDDPLEEPLPELIFETYPQLKSLPVLAAKKALWEIYCSLPEADRAKTLYRLLGADEITYDANLKLSRIFDGVTLYGGISRPAVDAAAVCQKFLAPALMITGWYDWTLRETLESWRALRDHGRPHVADRSRLLIAPAAHGGPGYTEGRDNHPELQHNNRGNIDLLTRWFDTFEGGPMEDWPRAIYYLMGANEWHCAADWPPPDTRTLPLYLGSDGMLSEQRPTEPSPADRYCFDPTDPTPTIGGSILSFLYPAGSVDVSQVQERPDVLSYTTLPLESDLDVVGPLRLVLYASSSAIDTDFLGRLSDVFPDGRALQLQNGILRARYRNAEGGPEWLEPGQIYRLEIDMWATANRFKAGHRIRLDISSADFPRFDRNSNGGGQTDQPVSAHQIIYHDRAHPSHLLLPVIDNP